MQTFRLRTLPLKLGCFAMFILMRFFTRWSMSRCRRRPKSLNIVLPPERTMFWYSARRVSMGHPKMHLSTTKINKKREKMKSKQGERERGRRKEGDKEKERERERRREKEGE